MKKQLQGNYTVRIMLVLCMILSLFGVTFAVHAEES